MNLKRVNSIVVSALPLVLSPLAACNAPTDPSAESADPGEANVGVAASALTGVSPISSGNLTSLAVRVDGTVWASGDNTHGQIGDGTNTNRTSPVLVGGLSEITAVAAGTQSYSLALRSDGTAWAWGYNEWGQLGIGWSTFGDQLTPTQISGLSNVRTLAAGAYHAHALLWDGTVRSWGFNGYDELGDGTSGGNSVSPVVTQTLVGGALVALSGITQVAAGARYALALRSDGTVWAWGRNPHGELGNGNTTNQPTAVQVVLAGGVPLSGITAVAAQGGSEASFALSSDGTLWAWGANGNGEMGNGTTGGDQLVPAQVLVGGVPLSGVTQVAAAGASAFALRSDGTVWSWGWNTNCALGRTGTNSTPAPISGLTGVTAITGAAAPGGTGSGFAQTSDGTVWAWGTNGSGQLGNGTTTAACTPVPTTFEASADGSDCATWPMPNPVSTGLPHPASYTPATGTVLDEVTGLVWEQPALGCSNDCSAADAATYCAGLGLGGYSDWRVPTRVELISIVDDTQHFPAVDPSAFAGTSNGYYWSSTPVVGFTANTFGIGGAEGDTSNRTGSVDNVRCVRSTASAISGHYVVEAGGTVLDTGTGLTWQQTVPSATYTQAAATSYCSGLGAGWRLPSMKELQSLVDDAQGSPAIDPTAFPGTPFDVAYWTSTPVAWQSGYAWYVLFAVGQANHDVVGATYHVRCVH